MDGEEWFSTEYGKGLSRVFSDSTVTTFVDAEEYYAELRREVEATATGGQICWIGFEASGDTPMPQQAATVEPTKNFPRG